MKKHLLAIVLFFMLVLSRLFLFHNLFSGKYFIMFYWLCLYIIYGLSGRLSLFIGSLGLFFIGALLLFNHQGLALRVSEYTWWFLIIGSFFLLLESHDKKNSH